MAAGGFVAGLDAGMGYNSWPLMDGALVPAGPTSMGSSSQAIFAASAEITGNYAEQSFLLHAPQFLDPAILRTADDLFAVS